MLYVFRVRAVPEISYAPDRAVCTRRTMPEAYIAVGDIHGCLDQLLEVLQQCAAYPGHRYVFLGDYIDRGPSSNEVIDTIRKLNAVWLMGNHEQSLIWYIQRNHDSAKTTIGANVPEISAGNLSWIQTELRLYYETQGYIFVHAGIDSKKALSQQDSSDLLWSRYDGDYSELGNRKVIHGHMKVDHVVQRGNRMNINTGAGFGGPLTAYVLPEMHVIQSSPSPKYSQGNLEKEREELLELYGIEAELEDV